MRAVCMRPCFDSYTGEYYKADEIAEIDPKSPIAKHFMDPETEKPVMDLETYRKLKADGEFKKQKLALREKPSVKKNTERIISVNGRKKK